MKAPATFILMATICFVVASCNTKNDVNTQTSGSVCVSCSKQPASEMNSYVRDEYRRDSATWASVFDPGTVNRGGLFISRADIQRMMCDSVVGIYILYGAESNSGGEGERREPVVMGRIKPYVATARPNGTKRILGWLSAGCPNNDCPTSVQ